mmetsp:Transcript_66251/g.96990  ORF Transcript_66251/g.96990 Transcript_66251/m.96990 type:complete len:947 (+) Transcript_66251:324-3164(+)
MSGTPPVPHAQARAAHPANAGGAALKAVTIKPFAISECATTEQRRAERKRDPSASHQEEFERKWCSYNPFKPIWRQPEPKPTHKAEAAKRKDRDNEERAASDARQPQHLELDKWLRHILASRRRDGATREAVKAEKRRRRAERKAKGKDAMSEEGSDSSDEEEEKLPVPTLQDRLLQAQIEIAVASNQSGQVGVAGDILRNEGLGSIDGVRCRLHSVDRLQGIEPCVFINLFAGGYSIDGEKSGRVYDHASKEFLAGLDRGKIPARKLLDLAGHSNFVYHDGCLLMGVRDFRMPRSFDQKPTVWTMVLGPDSGSLAQDLSIIAESHQNLNSDDLLLVEMRMLLATQPAVCLNPTPHVAVVASSLHRRANRMDVWHARPARSAFPQFRRTFDTGAMRRLHAAVHVSNIAGLEPAAPSLAASSRAPASEPWNGGGGSSSPRSTCKGLWKDNRLLEGWDLDGDGKDGAMMMATALRMLKASACTGDREVLTGAKSSHGTLGSKRESRLSDKTASEGGSGGERGIPRNYYVPRQYLRDGQPPERQMRFRKENQIVTIAIENKGASTYQLRSWLHEFGPDGKQLDNGQVHMPPQNVGNSHQARLFGGQLFGVYHREGWQCTGDSHQPAARKASAVGSSGGAAQGATSNGDAARAAAARPGAQAPAAGAHGRGVAAVPVATARSVLPVARAAPVGAYPSNGPASRPAQPMKPKTAPHVPAHQPVVSPHMMAGRGAPQVHGAMQPGAAGQARAPMAHTGGIPGQQMHMQQGYRPAVGMHQAQPHQHHPHQVPATHPAHAAHQAQGMPQYHAAAGRGYMPPHHPQVAGRGGGPVQPGLGPPGSHVAQQASAAAHQQMYKPHPGGAGVPGHAMPVPQHAQPTQLPIAAGMQMGVAGALMQHAGMPAGATLAHCPAPVAKPSVAPATAGRGQVPGQGPPMQHPTYQQQQQPPSKPT